MADDLIVSAGLLVAGPAAVRYADAAVLVRDGRIAAVGPVDEIGARAAPGAVRHDFPDATLLPGLVDAHVHLCMAPGLDPMSPPRSEDTGALRERMVAAASVLLAAGVTTARDLGDRDGLAVGLREEFAAGRLRGPRLQVAGSPLTPPRGHCWFLGGEVGDSAAAEELVDRLADDGVDWIKVMASGGQSTPEAVAMWERQFDEGQLRAVVERAASHGLPVAAHAHGADSIADAVAAGVRTVEHCSWMAAPEPGGPPRRTDRRPGVVARMVQQGTIACSGGAGDWRRLADRVGEAVARELTGRTYWMDAQGVRVLIGTDAGLAPFDALPAAVGIQVEHGFTPERALDLVTTVAADVLGLGAVTGRIAPGLDADLLVVDGDPLADPAALTRPLFVTARGRPV